MGLVMKKMMMMTRSPTQTGMDMMMATMAVKKGMMSKGLSIVKAIVSYWMEKKVTAAIAMMKHGRRDKKCAKNCTKGSLSFISTKILSLF